MLYLTLKQTCQVKKRKYGELTYSVVSVESKTKTNRMAFEGENNEAAGTFIDSYGEPSGAVVA